MVIAPFRIPDLESPDTDQAVLEPEERCIPTAESAECTCPDFCERDHDTD